MGQKRVVIQVGNDEYVAGESSAVLSAIIETIQWIDAETNCMCCAPGVVIWTLTADGVDVLQTSQKPKRVDGDDEVRYIFPAPPRLTGTYEEQRAEMMRMRGGE
jgi:hypothetical protein